MHSEQSYTLNFPRFICFWCKVPAATMGATPIASNRTILEGLPSELVEKFRRKGVLYRRTYTPVLAYRGKLPFRPIIAVTSNSFAESATSSSNGTVRID